MWQGVGQVYRHESNESVERDRREMERGRGRELEAPGASSRRRRVMGEATEDGHAHSGFDNR